MRKVEALSVAGEGAQVEVPGGPLRVEGAGGPLRLSLVIPTYNESRNLAPLVARLTEVLEARLPGEYELIVVDDDSPDRTWSLALELAQTYPALRVMRRRGEKGLSTAVIRGWQVARGQVLAVIDADLQHPPEVIAKLWDAIEGGADLAAGTRHKDGGGVSDWSAIRRGLSRGAQLLGLLVLPKVVGRVSDPMSGCFMLRRRGIQGVTLSPLGYKILIEVMGRGQFRNIAEVGYVFQERNAGESKVTWHLYVQYLAHLVRLRLATLPPRFLMYALVGASGVVVDMGMLFLLGDPRTLALGLVPAKALAVEAAIVNNFLWNDVWTFGDLTVHRRKGAARWKRFLKFNAVCGVGLLLSVALVKLQVSGFGINRYLANALAIGVVTVWNYWMNKRFSWAMGATLEDAVEREDSSGRGTHG